MPITPEHVGRTYPHTPAYTVSSAKIAEFAGALGAGDERDANPAYCAGENSVAPPTFAVVLAARAWDQLFDDPDLGLALSRVIHADQQFDYVRPLRVGDQVTTELAIEKVRNRGQMDWITVRARILTTAGEHVQDVVSTLVHTRPEGEQA